MISSSDLTFFDDMLSEIQCSIYSPDDDIEKGFSPSILSLCHNDREELEFLSEIFISRYEHTTE